VITRNAGYFTLNLDQSKLLSFISRMIIEHCKAKNLRHFLLTRLLKGIEFNKIKDRTPSPHYLKKAFDIFKEAFFGVT
jgi:hypothetical protein